MSTIDRMAEFATNFWGALGAGVAGGAIWLVRTILTNQRSLAELRAEIKAREKAKEAERQMLSEMQADIREVKADVKYLYAITGEGGSK